MIKRLPIPYIYCILIGMGLGIILGTKTYLSFMYWGEEEKFSWVRYFSPHFINNTLWGFLTPLVYYFMQKYQLSKSAAWKEKGKAIVACLAVATFHESLSYVVWFFPVDWLGIFRFDLVEFNYVAGAFPSGFISRVVEYWIIYGIFAAMDYSRKYRVKQVELAQMESRLAGAQLSALRLQLQPHFLFNTLNTISSLMVISIKDAQKMVSNLGKLLRTVLDKNKKQSIPLREELEFTEHYLNIEQMRFHDRLRVHYEVEEYLLDVPVPSLILQPLVENAIKHGFAQHTKQGTIQISAKTIDQNTFKIQVTDDGLGTKSDAAHLFSMGIGLRNVEERLNLIYRDKAKLDIVSEAEKGFTVTLILPILKKLPYEEDKNTHSR